jgi:hypothetical protein
VRVAACALALIPRVAFAQQAGACDLSADARGEELVVRPADGAEHVALNAPVVVRYAPDGDLDQLRASVALDTDESCRAREICLFEQRGTGAQAARSTVPGMVQALDDHTLAFTPSRALSADSRYFALVARPGFDSASRTEVEFHTGTALDQKPPELDAGGDALELDVEPPAKECDAPEGSLRVRVAVPTVHDDGDEESVELLLFLTRASGLRAPELRARAQNDPHDGTDLTFTLAPAQAADTVCVAVRAVDGTGKASEGEPELCFEPRAARRSEFGGLCALSAASAGVHAGADNGRGLLVASALVLAACVLRNKRRRTSSRAQP